MKVYALTLALTVGLIAGVPGGVHAQDDTQPSGQNPPAAVGEESKKPTRGFLSSLVHNLGDDVVHMPRRNSVYWLGGGGALALAIHPADNRINAHLVNRSSDALWTPGHVIGSTPVVLGSSAAVYILGRKTAKPRLQHLGMDEIEASLLAEGITEGMKVAIRRQRPQQIDGNQSSTYSFPSGHAMMTFATATVLQQHLGYRAGIPTYLVASYVAMSRLHDNRHYASDVAFGAAMGVVIGRSVTFHGRNFYGSPMLLPGGGGIQLAFVK
jgi:membrane-associated phospholipid phosphatase